MIHRPTHDPRTRLNDHHPDELLAVARTFGGHPDAVAARAERVDGGGIDLAIDTPTGPVSARVAFVTVATEAKPPSIRMAFRALAQQARAALAAGSGGDGPNGS
ncbi:MAG: DUF2470 domain-containing protein [Acidimicrobiales bacterium]